MNFANATNLNRKAGGAKWRDLQSTPPLSDFPWKHHHLIGILHTYASYYFRVIEE